MDPSYAALDEDAQVEVLLRVALAAAEAFGLEVRHLALVLHAYNTTFRLDTSDGRRLALRVNTNSQSTTANIAAQQAWLHALARDTDVLVPDPLTAPDGAWEVAVDCPEWGGPLTATVASWLDGDDVGECDEEQAFALGRTMAVLHDHAEGFELPAGADLPLFDEPLFHDRNLLLDPVPLPGGHAEVITEALARCGLRFAEVYAGAAPIVLHADLHGGNLKWHGGRLAVFDLDDAGFGVPALDLATRRSTCARRSPQWRPRCGTGTPRSGPCRTSPTRSSRPWWPRGSCCWPTACWRAAPHPCVRRPPTTSRSPPSGCAVGCRRAGSAGNRVAAVTAAWPGGWLVVVRGWSIRPLATPCAGDDRPGAACGRAGVADATTGHPLRR